MRRDVPGDYYRRLHEVDTRHWWHVGMHGIAAALLETGWMRGGSLLDAGCGTGGFLVRAASSGRSSGSAGFDVSPEAIELAREAVPEADLRVAPLDAHPVRRRGVRPRGLARRPPARPRGQARARPRGASPGAAPRGRAARAHERRVPQSRRERDDWRVYDAETLAAELRRAGFSVRRLTYANTTLSLAAAALGRLPHAPTDREVRHPEPGSGGWQAAGCAHCSSSRGGRSRARGHACRTGTRCSRSPSGKHEHRRREALGGRGGLLRRRL